MKKLFFAVMDSLSQDTPTPIESESNSFQDSETVENLVEEEAQVVGIHRQRIHHLPLIKIVTKKFGGSFDIV